MGCRELRRVGSVSAIIERDSFSPIQWGSGQASYPLRLDDWVEEICHSAVQLKCSFVHILLDAN